MTRAGLFPGVTDLSGLGSGSGYGLFEMESWFVRVFCGEGAPEFASRKKRRSEYFLRTLQGRKVSRVTPGGEEGVLVIKGRKKKGKAATRDCNVSAFVP